jgi:hypothetical protein
LNLKCDLSWFQNLLSKCFNLCHYNLRREPSVRETAEKKRKKTKPVGSRSLPFRPANQQAAMAVGRLGMDITASTMAGFQAQKNAKTTSPLDGAKKGKDRPTD